LCLPSLATTAIPWSELPPQVRQVIKFNVYQKEHNLKFVSARNRVEGSINFEIEIDIASPYKIYQENFNFSLHKEEQNPYELQLNKISEPDPIDFVDPIKNELVSGYKGVQSFRFELTPKREINHELDDPLKIKIEMDFQACSNTHCLLPYKSYFEESFYLPRQSAANQKSDKSFLEGAFDGNWTIWKLILLFFAGLLTAFTPCVYPLYPITLGLFTHWSKEKQKLYKPLLILYCIGIVLSFASVALFAVLGGGLFGQFAQSLGYQLFMGLLMIFMGLTMMGYLSFPFAAKMQNFFGSAAGDSSQKSSPALLLQALGMGLALGLVASPCVGPVLVSLLAWFGQQSSLSTGQEIQAFLLFALFGFGICVPLLILAWLGTKGKKILGKLSQGPVLKLVLGLIMILSSLFFLKPAYQIYQSKKSPNTESQVIKKSGLDYPIYNYSTRPTGSWSILDFRADWCAACVELEEKTFSHSKIKTLLKNKDWNLYKIDFTDMTLAKNSKLAKEYNIFGLPSVFIINPSGEICEEHTLNEFEDASSFFKRLNSAKKTCK